MCQLYVRNITRRYAYLELDLQHVEEPLELIHDKGGHFGATGNVLILDLGLKEQNELTKLNVLDNVDALHWFDVSLGLDKNIDYSPDRWPR